MGEKRTVKNYIRRSHKLDRIGVGRIRTFPFPSDFAYDSVAYGPVKSKLQHPPPPGSKWSIIVQ